MVEYVFIQNRNMTSPGKGAKDLKGLSFCQAKFNKIIVEQMVLKRLILNQYHTHTDEYYYKLFLNYSCKRPDQYHIKS